VSFEDNLKNAMLALIIRDGCRDAIRVESYEEKELSDGYCETCYYEYTVVIINYITSTGVRDEYEYYGPFSELIQELTTH